MSAGQFPTDPKQQAAYIYKARTEVVQKLAQAARKANAAPDAATEPGKTLYPRLDTFLSGLDEQVKMTPALRRETKIEDGLKLIFTEGNQFPFPQKYVVKAKALYEKWESEYWGGAPPPPPSPLVDEISSTGEENEDEAGQRPAKRQKNSSKTTSKDRFVVKLPPKDHSIWGVNGIMHGLATKINLDNKNSRSTALNEEYEHEKRSPKVFGHNGITPGTWYPLQLNALFHGAHGHSQGGISGDPILGAYSIVVSGLYGDLDQDRGETLYYSGNRSHDNTDPGRVAASSSGTRSLETSITSRRPVRVLRASRGHSKYAPTEGIRYDGLYRVVNKRYPRNAKGGMYEQFELVRQDGQISLDACRARPNGQDMLDFAKIKNGYSSRK